MIAVATICFTACDNKLDVSPKDQVEIDVALATPDDIEAAVNGLYGLMDRPGLYGTNLILLPELLGGYDNVQWLGTFQHYRFVYLKTMQATNEAAQETWEDAYKTINLANTIISKLDIIEDEDQRNRLEGEALFVRGIMHFELVRLYALPWGARTGNTQPGVVIKTTPANTVPEASEKLPRNTVAEVYNQVIQDLQSAAELLPDDRFSNSFKANKFTAEAFLVRVYMQQGNYAAALPLANDIIQNGGYALAPTPDVPYTNKNTSESIFEIQQNDQNNAGSSNDGLSTFFADSLGIGRGGDVAVEISFIHQFDENDYRRIRMIYGGETSGNFHTAKWYNPGQNIPVTRLAEMYLVRAECNLRLGSEEGDTPANDLNRIRSRAGVPDISDPTLEDVLLERRFELAFDGVRIHDIKRLRQSTFGGADLDIEYAWNHNLLVMPIPEREVRANDQLQQNPGY